MSKTSHQNTDMKLRPVIWVDRLTLFALPAVFSIARKNGGAKLRTFKTYRSVSTVIKLMKMITGIHIGVEKITYASLKDMWIGDLSMAVRLYLELPDIARRTLQVIKKKGIYKALCQVLPEEKVDIFFENKISAEILPIVRVMMAARWYRTMDASLYSGDIILYPDCGLIHSVKQVLSEDDVLVVFHRTIGLRRLKDCVKGLLLKQELSVGNALSSAKTQAPHDGDAGGGPRILLHYVEGMDLERRSDIFWYAGSGIRPEQVLIYFDLVKTLKKPVQEAVCKKIEHMGIRWVVLDRKAIVVSGKYIWKRLKTSRQDKINIDFKTLKLKRVGLDWWLRSAIRDLSVDIERWITFCKYFNVKIVVDIAAQQLGSIAQHMALDFVGGIRIGIQRSTILLYKCQPYLRYNANHIFFVWGKEAQTHKGTSKAVERLVVSGFPFDRAFHRGSNRRSSLNGNVKFVIALFDNVFAYDSRFSRKMVADLYRKFLEWVIEDREIAIITKEKKSVFFDRLTEVHSLASQAERAGRFIRLTDVLGRFPSDASCDADIAVGLCICSAVAEAIITGCKGVHCDLPRHRFHHFYKWGYEKIIFDDIDRLIEALKRYKKNPANEPGLGDWSSYIDTLEPFRDGKGGERIGMYIKWLLESFNDGKKRDNAIKNADRFYVQKWGEDKVIDRRDGIRNEDL